MCNFKLKCRFHWTKMAPLKSQILKFEHILCNKIFAFRNPLDGFLCLQDEFHVNYLNMYLITDEYDAWGLFFVRNTNWSNCEFKICIKLIYCHLKCTKTQKIDQFFILIKNGLSFNFCLIIFKSVSNLEWPKSRILFMWKVNLNIMK